MFTGIIRELGTVERLERRNGLVRLRVYAPKTAATVARLESVAINGVCLSAVDVRGQTLMFELIRETQALTALEALRRGDRIHVEPSLTLTDRLSGHVLLGHVDGVGTVVRRREQAGQLTLEIRVPASLAAFLTPKGPVAVDGVSLTVGRAVRGGRFTVHLIPETLRQTTLGERYPGDRVNLEVDYLAKLVHQFTRRRRRSS